MQQPQPQHPPIINVYNPPPNQQQQHQRSANDQPNDKVDNEVKSDEEAIVSQGAAKPFDDKPMTRDTNLSPRQPTTLGPNKSDSQLVDDTATRVKITRSKTDPNRLRELSHTPTTEPVSSNASSARVIDDADGDDIQELRSYHTNEVHNLQTRSRSSNKDLLRGYSNQTIGLQSILRQSPPHEV